MQLPPTAKWFCVSPLSCAFDVLGNRRGLRSKGKGLKGAVERDMVRGMIAPRSDIDVGSPAAKPVEEQKERGASILTASPTIAQCVQGYLLAHKAYVRRRYISVLPSGMWSGPVCNGATGWTVIKFERGSGIVTGILGVPLARSVDEIRNLPCASTPEYHALISGEFGEGKCDEAMEFIHIANDGQRDRNGGYFLMAAAMKILELYGQMVQKQVRGYAVVDASDGEAYIDLLKAVPLAEAQSNYRIDKGRESREVSAQPIMFDHRNWDKISYLGKTRNTHSFIKRYGAAFDVGSFGEPGEIISPLQRRVLQHVQWCNSETASQCATALAGGMSIEQMKERCSRCGEEGATPLVSLQGVSIMR